MIAARFAGIADTSLELVGILAQVVQQRGGSALIFRGEGRREPCGQLRDTLQMVAE